MYGILSACILGLVPKIEYIHYVDSGIFCCIYDNLGMCNLVGLYSARMNQDRSFALIESLKGP